MRVELVAAVCCFLRNLDRPQTFRFFPVVVVVAVDRARVFSSSRRKCNTTEDNGDPCSTGHGKGTEQMQSRFDRNHTFLRIK